MRPERFAGGGTLLLCCLALGSCALTGFGRTDTRVETTPVFDRSAASAALLAGYLELLQRLVQSPPAEQAELVYGAQRDYELVPTPSHQLRYALALAAPGHTGTDLPRAQRLLRELVAAPETLLPTERALAFLELQKVDYQLTLAAENRRLLGDASRADKERTAALDRRLKAEIEENARLRRELAEARAKLDAIANIERSLDERKPNSEGRTQ